jgi:hypothetical protein
VVSHVEKLKTGNGGGYHPYPQGGWPEKGEILDEGLIVQGAVEVENGYLVAINRVVKQVVFKGFGIKISFGTVVIGAIEAKTLAAIGSSNALAKVRFMWPEKSGGRPEPEFNLSPGNACAGGAVKHPALQYVAGACACLAVEKGFVELAFAAGE